MRNKLPLVTVVALCYNHEDYLELTLNSIVNQTYPEIELIIIEDCSRDGSALKIRNWLKDHTGSGVRYISNKENKGICKSLNAVLEHVHGTYFKLIACDDILMPDAIKTLVETFLTLTPEYAVVYADVVTIDEEGKVFGQSPFEERKWVSEDIVPSGSLFAQLAELCFIPAPSVLLKMDVLKEMRFDERLHVEDWDIWLRISKKYLIKGITDKVVYYRVHSRSMYQTKSPEFRNGELHTVKKHLGFSQDADVHFKKFIYENSLQLYLAGSTRHAAYWLKQRFLIHKSLKNFNNMLFAMVGVSFKKKHRFISGLKKIFQSTLCALKIL